MPTPRDLLLGLFKREELHDFAPEQDGLSLVGSYYQSRMELGSQRHKKYKDYRDMGESATIWTALELYAEEVTQTDQVQGASIWPVARNAKIESSLRRMLEKIGAEDQVFLIARYLAQYGDCFVRPLVAKSGSGVVGIEIIEAEDVTRVVDKHARLVGFRIAQFGDHPFDPHEIVHFRTLGKAHTIRDGGAVYGTSFLEGARRAWRISSMMEDVLVIYRLEVGGQHKVFYIDVGTSSYERALNIANDYKSKFSKREYFNPNTMEWTSRFAPFNLTADVFWPIREGSKSRIEYIGVPPNVDGIADVEYFHNQLAGVLRTPKAYLGYDDYCLAGDTPVYCLDGEMRTMKQLADNHADEEVWVMACDPETGKFKPAKASNFRITKRDEEVFRVRLDNGRHVDCSGNHKFLMRDGSWREAQDLQPNDSLMPFDTKRSEDGYELVRNPNTSRWGRMHWLVCRSLGMLDADSECIHHDNRRKRDNRPKNLLPMTNEEHHAIHADDRSAVIKELNADPRFRAAQLESLAKLNADPEFQKKRKAASLRGRLKSEEWRAHASRHGREVLQGLHADPEWAAKHKERSREQMVRQNQDPDFIRRRTEGGKKRRGKNHASHKASQRGDHWLKKDDVDIDDIMHAASGLALEDDYTLNKLSAVLGCSINRIVRVLKDSGYERTYLSEEFGKLKVGSGRRNHKVVGVEKLGERQDLYDMEVKGLRNFALDVGVFVHNSSVKYGLSQLDINFSRRGARLQRSVRRGFHAMGEIHLAFTGEKPRTEETRFLMMMVPPSMLDYEQRMEGIDMAIEVSRKVVELGQAMNTDPDTMGTIVKRLLIAAMPFDVGRALMMKTGSDTRLDIPEKNIEDTLLEHFSKSGASTQLREITSLYSGSQDASLLSEQFKLPEPEADITIPSICEEYTKKRAEQAKEAMDTSNDPFIIEMSMEQFEQLKPHLAGHSRPAFTAAPKVNEAVILEEESHDLTEENLRWAREQAQAVKRNGK